MLVDKLSDGREKILPLATGIEAVQRLRVVCKLYIVAVVDVSESFRDISVELAGSYCQERLFDRRQC